MPDDRMVMPTRRLRAYFRGLRCLRPVIRTAMKISTSTTVAYRPCTALTHHILWLSSALSAKCAVLIHYATVVLEVHDLRMYSTSNPRTECYVADDRSWINCWTTNAPAARRTASCAASAAALHFPGTAASPSSTP